MYLTGARSGVIGILLTFLIYTFLAALRKRQENPVSLGATSTMMAYPLAVTFVAFLVAFWRRANVMVFGGYQHESSSGARKEQWERGWELLAQNPIGHGASRSGEVLGFRIPSGKLTIDSYYLSVMLDFGVIALPIFIALFSLPLWYSYVSLRRARSAELELIVPLAIGLFNFVVIKSVLSSTSNFTLAFVMLGFSVALISRMKGDDAQLARDDLDTADSKEAVRRIGSARGRSVMG